MSSHDGSTPLLSYFAPLQKRSHAKSHAHHASLHWRQSLYGLLFLDRVEHKNVAVWLAAFHYLPIIAMLLATTVSCILHVFLSLVFPFVDNDSTSHVELTASGVSLVTLQSLMAPLVAHAGVFVGVSVVGYKAMCLVLDAMMDSCLYVVDPRSNELVPFYSLFHDLRLILMDRRMTAVCVVLLLALPCSIAVAYNHDVFGMEWTPGDSSMLRFCSGLFVVALLGVSGSFCRLWWGRQKEGLCTKEVMAWWRQIIPRVRRRFTYCVIVCSLYFFLEGGGSLGMVSFSEGMLYLALPHLWICLAARCTLFLMRVSDIARRANERRRYASAALKIIAPWCVMFAASMMYFTSLMTFAVQLPVLFTMLVTLRRLMDSAPAGESFSGLALRLYFCNTKMLQRKMPHFRAGILVRLAVRTILALTLFSVLGIGLWLGLQRSGLVIPERPTTCRALDDQGEYIEFKTNFMVANLHGLEKNSAIDPNSLVYEKHAFLYDTNRYQSLCSRWWRTVHAADLAFFSLLTYLDFGSDFDAAFDFFRAHRVDGSQWTLVEQGEHDKRKAGGAVFRHFRAAKDNISVIAVRGTALAEPHDFLQNIFVFAEAATFHLLGSLVPLGTFISDKVKADFFAVSSALGACLFGEDVRKPSSNSHYYHLQVENYVRRYVPQSDYVVFTGHSLGGVISQIVGGRMRFPSLSFSSPGVGLMYKKFQIPHDAVDAYSSNVIASNDVIPLLDQPSGAVYHIQCEHTRAQICHSIELHTIRMWSMCPQYRRMVYVNGSYVITPQPYEALLQTVLADLKRLVPSL